MDMISNLVLLDVKGGGESVVYYDHTGETSNLIEPTIT